MPPHGHNESSAQRDTEDTRYYVPYSLFLSLLTFLSNGLYVDRHCRYGFIIHEKLLFQEKKKRESFVIQRNLLLIVIRRNQSK